MNSEHFEPWKLTSSQKSQIHNFFSCSNSPFLASNRTVLLLCPPPSLHPKLGLTNLIVNNLFTRNPNLEEQIADQLGIARKEYHGESFEDRQCSKLLSCSAFLKEVVPPSDPPLAECPEALHCVVVGVFGQILDPETENDISRFEETFMGAMRTRNPTMTPKLHMLVHHVPKCVRCTGIHLRPTSEQAPKSQHTFFAIFYHRFKVNCTNSPVFRERLLSALLHYNACHLYIADWSFVLYLPYFTCFGQLGVDKSSKRLRKLTLLTTSCR